MIAIICKFIVKANREKDFIQAWTDVTQAYQDNCNSLGPRLHKHGDNEYIAYAQWPSKEIHVKAELPEDIKNSSCKIMREC